MSDWALLFLVVWFLGTGAGTAFAVLLVRGGALRPQAMPDDADPETGRQAA